VKGGSRALARIDFKKALNNYVLIVFYGCRYDTFVRAHPRSMCEFGRLESRYSYTTWTALSHYNLLTGLLPHSSSVSRVRVGVKRNDMRAVLPRMNFEPDRPSFYLTHAGETHCP
jgi:hypothetical protein